MKLYIHFEYLHHIFTGLYLGLSRVPRKQKRSSKLVTTSFSEREIMIIDGLRKFLADTGALDKGKDGKASYYAFLRLAVFELVKKINSTLFKPDEEIGNERLKVLNQ